MYRGILEPVSNRETWTETVHVVDDDGTATDISAATIVVGVRNQRTKASALTATLANGKLALGSGDTAFTWTFSTTDMRSLCAGTYDVGCTIEIAGVTTQLIVGTVEIVDGVVT